MKKSKFHFSVLFLCLFNLMGAQSVSHVEPPNWWVDMKCNVIDLMLYGEDLADLKVKSSKPGIRVLEVKTLTNPNYAIVKLEIPYGAEPNLYVLEYAKKKKFNNRKNRQTIEFPVYGRKTGDNIHQGFSNDDIVYLIMPDRFANGTEENDSPDSLVMDLNREDPGARHGGDLKGITDHLEYIKKAGFTAIWLNPVLENNQMATYHGYSTTDLYNIDGRLGSNAEYAALVTKAHELGLKVIYDHISNHISIDHPWLSSLPENDFLNGSKEEHYSNQHFLNSFTDPYADPYTKELHNSAWFVPTMPDLNQKNPYVASYIIQNMIWWLELTGLDGVREDTYPYADLKFQYKWTQALLEEYPNLNVVGEVWSLQPGVIAQYQTGNDFKTDFKTALPSVMDFPYMTVLRDYLKDEGNISEVYDLLSQDYLYADPNALMTFVGNHDTPRPAFLNSDLAELKIVYGLLLTTRGIPQILYGDEIGMVGGESHVLLREEFPGGFSGADHNAFEESGRTKKEQEVFSFIQTMNKLRLENESLRSGEMVHYPSKWGQDVYAYFKKGGNQDFFILINGATASTKLDLLPHSNQLANYRSMVEVFTGKQVETSTQEIELAAKSFQIFKLIK